MDLYTKRIENREIRKERHCLNKYKEIKFILTYSISTTFNITIAIVVIVSTAQTFISISHIQFIKIVNGAGIL